MLVFRILNILVDVSAAVSYMYYAADWNIKGFALLPLPCSEKPWRTTSALEWVAEFMICYQKRTMYGLSETGALTEVSKSDVGTALRFSSAEWEDWVAEVGDIGTLIMIIGDLL